MKNGTMVNLSKAESLMNGLMCKGVGPVALKHLTTMLGVLARDYPGEPDRRNDDKGAFTDGERLAYDSAEASLDRLILHEQIEDDPTFTIKSRDGEITHTGIDFVWAAITLLSAGNASWSIVRLNDFTLQLEHKAFTDQKMRPVGHPAGSVAELFDYATELEWSGFYAVAEK